MAKLKYALIIAQDPRFTRLANLSLGYRKLALTKLMPRLLEQVDDNHLELLAESRSMVGSDGYWLAKDNKTRRQLIKDAVFLHRRKGTPWAVREICRRLGFGDIKLIEGLGGQIYNGSINHKGIYMYGDHRLWAHYSIILSRPITNTEARLLRETLPAFAPARCVLVRLDYQNSPLYYNSNANFDGDYNFGAV